MIARLMVVAAIAFASVSCASAPYVQKEKGVLKLVSLINEGGVSEVERLTPAPFALDGETLYLESDIATFWKNLKAASFEMADARFVETEPVGPESYKAFADTFDMKNFFEKYTGKDTSIVSLDTRDGRYYLLLERKVRGYPKVRGLKGPVQ